MFDFKLYYLLYPYHPYVPRKPASSKLLRATALRFRDKHPKSMGVYLPQTPLPLLPPPPLRGAMSSRSSLREFFFWNNWVINTLEYQSVYCFNFATTLGILSGSLLLQTGVEGSWGSFFIKFFPFQRDVSTHFARSTCQVGEWC